MRSEKIISIVIFLSFIILTACENTDTSAAKRNRDAMFELDKATVTAHMLDPDSVKFRFLSYNGILCGQFNAKNRFGGYTGYKRFVYGSTKYHLDIEGETDPKIFKKAWRNCSNPYQF